MKRLYIVIILLAAFLQQLMAQEAFYVYRNDGQFNAFFFDEVDSMAYSQYDVDSLYHEDYVVQEVFTSDSTYRIPLAVIDSIGFVTPETIYMPDVVHLYGELYDYLVTASADSMCVIFSSDIPLERIPVVGDKIAALELTDKNPSGFAGRVVKIERNNNQIYLKCEQLMLEEVVSRFYGVANIISEYEEFVDREYVPKRKSWPFKLKTFDLKLPPRLHLPIDIEKTGFFKKEKVFEADGHAQITLDCIEPKVTGRISYIINLPQLSNIHLRLTCSANFISNIAIAGKMGKGLNWAIGQDLPIWGVPLIYLAAGIKCNAEAELATDFTLYANFKDLTLDITDYPLLPRVAMINPRIIPIRCNGISFPFPEWNSFAVKGEASLVIPYINVGICFGKHEIGWTGIESETGIKADLDISYKAEDLSQAGINTLFYDLLKDRKIGMETYFDIKTVFRLAKSGTAPWDDYNFKIETSILDIFGWDKTIFRKECWFLPQFRGTDAKWLPNNLNAIESTPILYGNCLIPYTVGNTLFDQNKHKLETKYYKDLKYWKESDQPAEPLVFNDGINRGEDYTMYPSFKLFGMDILASPSTNVEASVPVTITSVNTTTSLYRPKGHPQHFTYKDKLYEFKYNVATTVTLSNDEGVENWGYCYKGPENDSVISRISLKGAPYTYEDKRFPYYRNGSPTGHTARLYPFVKYTDDDKYYYGEPIDYPLIYPDTSKIELTGCSTPEVVTRQNVEYNGAIYDYCSTFIIDYTATGAYWISVGAEKFGNGWNTWEQGLFPSEQAKAMDGSNRLTLNFYYNARVLYGDYYIRLKGTDDTHEAGSCVSNDYVRLIHNGQVFTGCELKR